MRGSLCKPSMSFIWLFSICPSLSIPHPLCLLPSSGGEKKKVCRMFWLAGPLRHQYSQARGSLGAHVVKKRNCVEDKRRQEGETIYQGKCLSGAISMKAVCTLKSRWVTRSKQTRPNLLCPQMWNWAPVNKDPGCYSPIEERRILVLSWQHIENIHLEDNVKCLVIV